MVTNRTHKWWIIGIQGMDFPVRIACFLRTTVIFEIEVRFKFTQLYLLFGKSDVGDFMMVTFLWNWSPTSNLPNWQSLWFETRVIWKLDIEIDLKFSRVIQTTRKPRDEKSRGSNRPVLTRGCLFPWSKPCLFAWFISNLFWNIKYGV